MGLMGKDRKTLLGKALFTVRGGRALNKWVLLFSCLTAEVF